MIQPIKFFFLSLHPSTRASGELKSISWLPHSPSHFLFLLSVSPFVEKVEMPSQASDVEAVNTVTATATRTTISTISTTSTSTATTTNASVLHQLPEMARLKCKKVTFILRECILAKRLFVSIFSFLSFFLLMKKSVPIGDEMKEEIH